MKSLTIYGPFSQLLCLDETPGHGALSDDNLKITTGQGIAVESGIIIEIGDFESLLKKYPQGNHRLSERKSYVAIPAFVDCHTHICWGGTRVNDYAMRVAGKSYLDIARSGGGIMDTVKATRKADSEELTEGLLLRAEEHIRRGIATIEIKSGYGLTVKDELKMLRCIKAANEQSSATTLVPTFLGAHIKPKEFNGSHREYLEVLLEDLIPVIQKEELADRADIFVEEGAFGAEDARWYARKIKDEGFDITMHVDQFHSGGSVVAVEEGCVSADHLEFTDNESVKLFNNSDTVAVALPGASMGLGMQFAPARQLLDAGASLAIASDWNPGSAPMGDLVTQASLLGAYEKLTIAETLAGITTRAARALRIEAGTIQTGKKAAFTIFKTSDYRDIFYRQGQLCPSFTVIGDNCISNE